MLVLTRKPGEAIHIGDGIVITILEIDSKACRIGISAPASIPVYRAEVYRRIQEENRKAAQDVQPDLQALSDLFRRKENKTEP